MNIVSGWTGMIYQTRLSHLETMKNEFIKFPGGPGVICYCEFLAPSIINHASITTGYAFYDF